MVVSLEQCKLLDRMMRFKNPDPVNDLPDAPQEGLLCRLRVKDQQDRGMMGIFL
jgi:hypothetical protein